jgi:hypothetical protein
LNHRQQSATYEEIRELNGSLELRLTDEIKIAEGILHKAIKDLGQKSRKQAKPQVSQSAKAKEDGGGQESDEEEAEIDYFATEGPGSRRGPPSQEVLFLVTKDLQRLAITATNIKRKLEIFQSLSFPGISFRRSHINEAHNQTFGYMFNNHFSTWLQSCDERIFWISGKPGSGKSTLTKYLVQHMNTVKLLGTWAGSRILHITSHFFWINGSDLQRSQEGLLRVLLLDVFQEYPDLIPKWLQDRKSNSSSTFLTGRYNTPEWTWKQLSAIFQSLVSETRNTHCFCVFVDGLDEFSGNKDYLIQSIQRFSAEPNVKLCVASRPWNVFERAFGDTLLRKIYLQDINKPDIAKFVQDTLQSRQDYQSVCEEHPGANELLDEIIEKSNGVFLWTYLVVRSLVEGLENDDRLMDLQRRLNDFPSDLNQFFAHMLQSLDPIYQAQIVRGFQALLCCRGTLSVLNFWYMDREEESPGSALLMAHADRSTARGIQYKSDAAKILKMKNRINARFKGLLEPAVSTRKDASLHSHKVDFLHRTVKDFLMTSDAQGLIAKWELPKSELYLLLGKSTLAEIRSFHPDGAFYYGPEPVGELINDVFFAAKEYEKHNNSSMNDVMEALNNTLTAPGLCWPKSHLSFVFRAPFVAWRPDNIVYYAIGWHLVHFVQSKLATSEIKFQDKFLFRALNNWRYHPKGWFSHQSCDDHLRLLAVLLDLRGSPKVVECPENMQLFEIIEQESKLCCSRTSLFSAFKLLRQRGVINRSNLVLGRKNY